MTWNAFQLPSDAPCEVLRGLMNGYVMSCAAWLISTHRHKLREFGIFYIHVPIEDEPQWLRLVAELLSTRPAWDVSWVSTEELRVYRFTRQGIARSPASTAN